MFKLIPLIVLFAVSMSAVAQSYDSKSALNESTNSVEEALILEAGADLERRAVGYRCCAGDVGYEEHGDHFVQAVSQIGGEARAVELCQTFHGRCQSYGCTKN